MIFFTSENLLLVGSILIFCSILITKAGGRFGLPVLLLFLVAGMLFGCDGLGINFDNMRQAQFVGMVALCVKGNTLSLYDVDMGSNLGQLLYAVELKQIENLKIRCNLFSQVLKFTYQGCTYAFTNFLGVKPALKVIEEEAKA